MAQELKTQLRLDGRIFDVSVLLGPAALEVRGGATMTIPFTEMFAVDADSGWLELKTARGLILLELGPKAESWKERIKNPRALAEKLGVDATKKVCVVGKLDADVRADIEASGAKVAKSARGKGFDVLFVAANAKKDLERLASAKSMMAEDGAIWILYPTAGANGRKVDPELTERAVLTAGRTLTLTDNKQLALGDSLSAVRFVIPASYRKKKR